MKRSVFLWITGLAAAAWGATVYARPEPYQHALGNEIPATRMYAVPGLTGPAGRCVAARKATRWSGYTRDDAMS